MYQRGLLSHGWRGRILWLAAVAFVLLVIFSYIAQEMGYIAKWDADNTSRWMIAGKAFLLVAIAVVVGALGNAAWEAYKAWRENQALDDTPTFWKNHHYADAIGLSIRQMLLEIAGARGDPALPTLTHKADRANLARLASNARSRWNRFLTVTYLNAPPHQIPILFREQTYTHCLTHDGFAAEVTDGDVLSLLTKLGGRKVALTEAAAERALCARFRQKMFQALREVEKHAAGTNPAMKTAIEREEKNADRRDREAFQSATAGTLDTQGDKLDRVLEILQKQNTPPPSIGAPRPELTPEERAILDAAKPSADASRKYQIAVAERDYAVADAREAEAVELMKRRQSEERYQLLMAQGRSRYDRRWYADAQPFFAQAQIEKPGSLDAEWYEASCIVMPNPTEDLIERANRVFIREMRGGTAYGIGGYAMFLHSIRKDYDEAEAQYRRALVLNPKEAQNLSNFGLFLSNIRRSPDEAESMYRRALEVDPQHVDSLNNYAIFLSDVRNDPVNAELMFKRAIQADPTYANALAAYGRFLGQTIGRHDEAEALFLAAVNSNPKHPGVTGAYATFLENNRKDDREAEAYYLRAIEADPKHANNLGNYAVFLETKRDDPDGAEAYYRRAIEADPKHAGHLGNYADFLQNKRDDPDRAEAYYQRAIEANPKYANSLGNYAVFLQNKRDDPDGAEAHYKRAIEADPKHANNLGNYAVFLTDIRGKHDEAEALYRRAIEADPKHANHLGNYAEFLLLRGRGSEAASLLEQYRAAATGGLQPEAVLASWMLAYCLLDGGGNGDDLTQIKSIVTGSETRHPTFRFAMVIAQAKARAHPEAGWLDRLAEVVAGRAGPEMLNDWPAWRDA